MRFLYSRKQHWKCKTNYPILNWILQQLLLDTQVGEEMKQVDLLTTKWTIWIIDEKWMIVLTLEWDPLGLWRLDKKIQNIEKELVGNNCPGYDHHGILSEEPYQQVYQIWIDHGYSGQRHKTFNFNGTGIWVYLSQENFIGSFLAATTGRQIEFKIPSAYRIACQRETQSICFNWLLFFLLLNEMKLYFNHN